MCRISTPAVTLEEVFTYKNAEHVVRQERKHSHSICHNFFFSPPLRRKEGRINSVANVTRAVLTSSYHPILTGSKRNTLTTTETDFAILQGCKHPTLYAALTRKRHLKNLTDKVFSTYQCGHVGIWQLMYCLFILDGAVN